MAQLRRKEGAMNANDEKIYVSGCGWVRVKVLEDNLKDWIEKELKDIS